MNTSINMENKPTVARGREEMSEWVKGSGDTGFPLRNEETTGRKGYGQCVIVQQGDR